MLLCETNCASSDVTSPQLLHLPGIVFITLPKIQQFFCSLPLCGQSFYPTAVWYTTLLHTFDDKPLFSLSDAPSVLVLQWLWRNKVLIFLVKSVRRLEIHIKDPPLPGYCSWSRQWNNHGARPVQWWQQYPWPSQGLTPFAHSFGCCIDLHSIPEFVAVPKMLHGTTTLETTVLSQQCSQSFIFLTWISL